MINFAIKIYQNGIFDKLEIKRFYNYLVCFPEFFRTLSSFELWMKKGGKSTDYYLPTEMLVMINVVLDYKNQVS